MAEMYEKEETKTTSITTTTAATNPSSAATAPSVDEMGLFLHHILSTPSSSSSPLIPPEKAVKLMSFGSSSSDVALERAGGIIPQSVWDVFCHFKTLQSGLPTPPPPFLPPLPVDLNLRERTSIAESSAVRESSALIFSGERSASSIANFPSASTVGDDSDKKESQCIADSGALCSIGPLLERQDSLCLPSSLGSLGSPVRDLISGKRRKPPDINWDDFDCESEEGQEALEDLSKPVASRTSLKRSRAAEVHNLSEKRRRSRINEKMKALQNLIPNSNKTDKASMLDEAIEYLKHLQLQVQMLSMRNGLNLSTMYIPGGLQPMQMSPMHMGFDIENASPEMGMGMLPINQGPSTHPPLMNQMPSSHQPIVSENSFGMDPSPVHFGPTYQLATSAEGIYSVGSNILPQHKLGMIRLGRNLSAENKTKPVVSSLPLDGQAAMVEGGNCLEACTIVCGENSQQILAGNADTRVLIPHLHDVKTATRIHGDGIEEGARDF